MAIETTDEHAMKFIAEHKKHWRKYVGECAFDYSIAIEPVRVALSAVLPDIEAAVRAELDGHGDVAASLKRWWEKNALALAMTSRSVHAAIGIAVSCLETGQPFPSMTDGAKEAWKIATERKDRIRELEAQLDDAKHTIQVLSTDACVIEGMSDVLDQFADLGRENAVDTASGDTFEAISAVEMDRLLERLRKLPTSAAQLVKQGEAYTIEEARDALQELCPLDALDSDTARAMQSALNEALPRRPVQAEGAPHGEWSDADYRAAHQAIREHAGYAVACDALDAVQHRLAAPVAKEGLSEEARRYRRLRVLGCAPSTSPHLESGTVLCFTNLDEFVDADLAAHPSRGEASEQPASPPAVDPVAEVLKEMRSDAQTQFAADKRIRWHADKLEAALTKRTPTPDPVAGVIAEMRDRDKNGRLYGTTGGKSLLVWYADKLEAAVALAKRGGAR